MAFTPFTKDERPTMAAFNEKFQALLGEGLRMETGTYVGTGSYGINNSIRLTFQFTPKLVIVHQVWSQDGDVASALLVNGITRSIAYSGYYGLGTTKTTGSCNSLLVTWGDGEVSWFTNHTNSQSQLNILNQTYRYVAIG